MEIEKQQVQDSFTIEMDTSDQPRLCSTQITGKEDSKIMFKLEYSQSENFKISRFLVF